MQVGILDREAKLGRNRNAWSEETRALVVLYKTKSPVIANVNLGMIFLHLYYGTAMNLWLSQTNWFVSWETS